MQQSYTPARSAIPNWAVSISQSGQISVAALPYQPKHASNCEARRSIVMKVGAVVSLVITQKAYQAFKQKRSASTVRRLAKIDRSLEVPNVDLPSLPAEKALRLKRLLCGFSEIYEQRYESRELKVNESEYLEIFRPRGCSPTYGELDQTCVARLLEVGGLTAEDTFVDIGSGLGKLVVVAAALSDAKACYGVELSPARHRMALEALERLQQEGLLTSSERGRIKLFCGDCGSCEEEGYSSADASDEVLQCSHFLLTMKKSTSSTKRLLASLTKSRSEVPRILWSVAHNLPLRAGMDYTRRFKLPAGFELPAQQGPNFRGQRKLTDSFVVHEYTLAAG
eukprot:TRINITY_DN37210_c0_g1_i1.p1 TRINITY_DN37210_c0_g1~~TRINITY_DN37210_c0_g1_i1.p1  ORF type:complete len:338 (+),score=43.59 TRINITY_DN37210_c0_g1_i1:94-1107(+)